jgi:lipopolysaccharide transport system permease protein
VNPVLLLLTYWLVFTYMLPAARNPSVDRWFIFLFCGILPWTAFQASVQESSGVLIAGGNLIKKVLFPAEVLPVVTVLTNTVQMLLGLPILLVALLVTGKLQASAPLMVFPFLVQVVFTLGVALLVSALTVHFRDVQSILGHLLHVWFFATPILYLLPETGRLRMLLRFNPLTHVIVAYQDVLYFGHPHLRLGLLAAAGVAVLSFAAGAFLFDRLRDTLAEEV